MLGSKGKTEIHGFRAMGDKLSRAALWMLHWRYAAAGVIFVVLVAFGVSGSNLGCWDGVLNTPEGQTSTLAGSPRGIRADEWSVLFPIYFAQQNSVTPFSASNPELSLDGMYVLAATAAPVRDVYMIAKPLVWGFFFLDAGRAVAWYWNLKLLLILLLSYELCRILSRGSRLIGAVGAVWIAFSPAVQWWFIQHAGDNVLYAEAMAVTFYYLLKFWGSLPKQIGMAALFSLSCLGFLTPLYPALQVPFGLLAVLLMVLFLLDRRRELRLRPRDAAVAGGTLLFLGLMAVHVYLLIRPVIPLYNATEYPGQRVSTGGGTSSLQLLAYLSNLWTPYHTVYLSNPCELSSFYNFLPAVLAVLPALAIRLRRRKTLKTGLALAAFSVFFALYTAFSFLPEKLARLTLLSYVTGQRAMLAYSYAALLLSVWALGELSRTGGVGRVYSLAVSAGVAALLSAGIFLTAFQAVFSYDYDFWIIMLLAGLSYLLLRGKKRGFAAGIVALSLAAGATVNPVHLGAGALLDSPTSEAVRQIDAESGRQELWLASTQKDNVASADILLYANGAHSLGGVHNYPDERLWRTLDPSGGSRKIYNRSAHFSFELTAGRTTFQLVQTNVVHTCLSVGDLQKLGVRYVLSKTDLTPLQTPSVRFQLRRKADRSGLAIYEVSYR